MREPATSTLGSNGSSVWAIRRDLSRAVVGEPGA
jgi:hypothetical protein